ncbi:MAG: class A beta-lactamase-related serine hydrolase [Candidatus Marinimicrobia bacterium]|nr:class A beta-lactamase-related serine hydrolase [Candidatus Neomarinimicrobiota bacterium]MCF7921697.1 class A beta-lactamase-related serine hydrolase [Candidatus Neomarinimicrobiota bacterium]
MQKLWRLPIILILAFGLFSCSGLKKSPESETPHEVGIAYMNLETGEILAYGAHKLFHAASTMKTPVMFQLFRMRDQGQIDLSAEIPIVNQFSSIIDGSLFSLSIESEKDEILYPFLNQKLSIYDIMEKMITHSSNLATNILMEYTGADSIGSTMREIKADGVLVIRGVEDLKAYNMGLNNMTTAYGMMKVMEAVYHSELVSDSSHQEMIEILKRQHYNTMIPAGLPPDVVVAHKTGSITKIAHDAALVFPPQSAPYVLVILTRGWDDHAAAQRVGARISSKVYDYHRGLLKRTDIVIPDLIGSE